MAIPLALMAAGTAVQIFGQYSANYSQAQAEIQNAQFYKEQADFAWQSSIRQANIASREYEARKGAQISAFAKGGVDMSGSAASVIADTLSARSEELMAIERKGQIEFKLARSRGRQAEGQAALLQDPIYNATQAGTTALTNYAAYKKG